MSKAFEAMWLVYLLDELRFWAHGHEVWALGSDPSKGIHVFLPHVSKHGPFKLRRGEHIAEVLAGFDDVFNYCYCLWMRKGRHHAGMGTGLHPDVVHQISNIILRIMSKFSHEQE